MVPRRKRTWSRSSRASETSASEAGPMTMAGSRAAEEGRNFALDNFLAGIKAKMTSTQETPAVGGGVGGRRWRRRRRGRR